MKTKFKVGQEVECLIYGKGVVTEIYSDKNSETDYPVHVKFLHHNNSLGSMEYKIEQYTADGRLYVNVNRTLTTGTWKVEEILPEPTFQKGQPVWVRDNDNQMWSFAYYNQFHENLIHKHEVRDLSGNYITFKYVKPFEGKDPNE